MGRGGQHSLEIGPPIGLNVPPDPTASLADDPVFAPFAQEAFDANDFASSALAGSQNTAQVCTRTP